MPPLQPLPQAILTAAKLREEAKRLNLIADELEASVNMPKEQPSREPVEWPYGTIKWEKGGGKARCSK